MTYPAPMSTDLPPPDAAPAILRALLAADIDLDDAAVFEPRAQVDPVEMEIVMSKRGRAMDDARKVVGGCCG